MKKNLKTTIPIWTNMDESGSRCKEDICCCKESLIVTVFTLLYLTWTRAALSAMWMFHISYTPARTDGHNINT